MATSPPVASPTLPYLTIPKKRPSLSIAGPSSAKRRKPSTAGPSHLRQTSFPPEIRDDRSPSVDSSVLATTPSVMSGRGIGGRKKKVTGSGGGKDDGSNFSGSLNGRKSGKSKEGTVIAGGGSTLNGTGGGDEDVDGEEDEVDEIGAMVEGGKMSEAALKQEREHLAMLLEAFTPDQTERYDTWRRVKLRKESVRKLTNHTLSQSVPANIVTTINGYTKVLISELVERARDVQLEWQAATSEPPAGEVLGDDELVIKMPKLEDRGPLTPDHMREAFRRYKKDREGGCAGLLGLSLQGRESTACKMGGKKLFR